jgi:nickel-dependent lactate racemase
MVTVLRYGRESSVCLDLPEGVLVAECGTPSQTPVADLDAAMTAALAAPLNYPPLAASTAPGDTVVVALEQGLPQASQIAAAVVRSLERSGVGADGIKVLHSHDDSSSGLGDLSPWLPQEIAERVTILAHDPASRENLAYLAATEAGEPIVLARAITDADVVLPVGCFSNRRGTLYHGIHGAIYPNFSDTETLARFRSPKLVGPAGVPLRKALLKTCNDVGWLLGVTLTIQIVPGPGDTVLDVLAGEVGAVRQRGKELYEAAWGRTVPSRASLVVASLEGGDAQQTWMNVGEALAAAAGLVEEGGAIALCCDLEAAPGPAIRCLARARSKDSALRRIQKERPADVLAATQLSETLKRASVYLLSRLDEGLVEDLEIAPLSEPAEVARLAKQHSSCIVLANAAQAMVRVS